VLDRLGVPGGAYLEMYAGIELASPRVFTALPGLPLAAKGTYVTAGEYADYLSAYAEHHRIAVTRATVEGLSREGRSYRVRTEAETLVARAVVVATGMWSFPVVPDLAAGATVPVLHAHEWRGPEAHPGERVLVVGGGTSGVEIAEHTARAGRRVWISARSPVNLVPRSVLGIDVHHFVVPLAKLPTWVAPGRCARPPTLPATDLGFSAMRRAGAITVVPALTRIEGRVAHFAGGASEVVDVAILATGFRHDAPFVPAEVARAPGGHLLAKGGESVSWPGLFVLGAPCVVGFDSEFLRGVAQDAELVAGKIERRARGRA
jgi:putative flavoprotein involved in K+ transport